MKRFLVLLIIVAGGLAWAAWSVPTSAAVVNGVAISQHSLNSDVTAIAKSPDYQCYINAQEYLESDGQQLLPLVDGVGYGADQDLHPTATVAFTDSYLDTAVGHQLILELAAQHHVVVTSQELATARTALTNEISSTMSEVLQTAEADNARLDCGSTVALTGAEVLATMPSSFVNSQVVFDATATAFQEDLSGVGSTPAALDSYFNAHPRLFDLSCITLAAYTSASAAQAGLAEVTSGTPFATVAAKTTGGGPQGCTVLYNIIADLPATSDLGTLALNTPSMPISYDGEYLVVEITSRTPSSYATAATAVQHAVEALGGARAQRAIDAAEKQASVQIDPRYGTWIPATAQIVSPLSPALPDVLNSSVNSPATSRSSSTFSTVPSSAGQSG
jgi:hypothetical protein